MPAKRSALQEADGGLRGRRSNGEIIVAHVDHIELLSSVYPIPIRTHTRFRIHFTIQSCVPMTELALCMRIMFPPRRETAVKKEDIDENEDDSKRACNGKKKVDSERGAERLPSCASSTAHYPVLSSAELSAGALVGVGEGVILSVIFLVFCLHARADVKASSRGVESCRSDEDIRGHEHACTQTRTNR
jgi:hypothetical protein